MNARVIFYMYFLFLSLCAYSQEYQKNLIWVKPRKEQAKPKNIDKTNFKTKEFGLNTIFEKNQVISYRQAMPFAKNPKLLEIYEIVLNGNPDKLIEDINKDYSDMFKDFNIQQQPIATYEPSDSMWLLTRQYPNEWMWYLPRIEADKAWDITHGSDDVTIAIIDTKFDLLHPDLVNKFIVNYDPYTGIAHQGLQSGDINQNHGTCVASVAVGCTDGGGQMASIGFNTKFYGYTWDNGLVKALHASNVMNADIISISWFSSCYPNPDHALIIQEILDNGTVICASAGNGSSNCNGGELYPFGTGNEARIIKVTTTGKNDCHQYSGRTDSHYPGVDICAPGEGNILAIPSVGNTWPYWCVNGQTSTATPIIAGVCALMLSVNPCLTPVQVEAILKETADPIIDADSFPGMLGGGRVNAYKALKAAGTSTYIDTTFTGNQYLTAGYGFNLTNVSIGYNSNISLKARKELNIIGDFEVPLGGTFSIDIDSTARTNCQ